VSFRSKNAGTARFSPDGKLLAFYAGPRADGTWDLTVVSSTGGPERVLANYARPGSQAWSSDGASVYVSNSSRAPGAIERIALADGRSEVVVAQSPTIDFNSAGLSPDGQTAIYHANPDRFFYRTATGAEGEIPVPLPQPIDWGSGRDMSLTSSRYTLMTHAWRQRLCIHDVVSGQTRDLLPGEAGSAPVWSADARRLAVLVGNRSHYDIATVNADGSGLRRYPVSFHVSGWGGAMPWSPDERFLFFLANDRQEVSSDTRDEDQLGVLDLASGRARILATISPGVFGGFAWRSDSKGVRARRSPWGPAAWLTRIVEVDLNGTERLLRDISPEFREPTRIAFADDGHVVLAVKLGEQTDRFLVPLDGRTAQRLQRLPEPAGEGLPASLGWPIGGNRLIVQGDPSTPVVSILSTAGQSTRKVNLPTGTLSWRPHPDGKHIVATVRNAGSSVDRMLLVPFDGTAPRFIIEIPRITGPRGAVSAPFAVSPDGNLYAYIADDVFTTKIFEVDFNPALQAIMKR
jgi:Tol biopolymer transport system component